MTVRHMQCASAMEMASMFLASLFLPYAVRRCQRRVGKWQVPSARLSAILFYAYVIPNFGSLSRLRYGFLMLLTGIGSISVWRDFRNRTIWNRP